MAEDLEEILRECLATLIVIVGFALGLYIGVWVMLIGGIKNIFEAVSCENGVLQLGWAVSKMLLSFPCMQFCFSAALSLATHSCYGD